MLTPLKDWLSYTKSKVAFPPLTAVPPSARGTLSFVRAIVMLLALLFVAVWQAPPHHAFEGLASYLPLHSVAEMVSIIVAMMVFGVTWNAYSTERSGNLVILACACFATGLIDFAHMLSFKGMPDFITPAGPEKAINFWLAARFLFAGALLVVALRSPNPLRSPWTRHILFAGAFGITLVVYWIGLVYADSLPQTFIEGQGLTTFKIASEYVIITLFVGAAALFYPRGRALSEQAALLFGAAAVSALSELTFTLYSSVTDVFNLLGHIYKIVAYFFVYHAIFVESVKEPFERLIRANENLAQDIAARKQAELRVQRLTRMYAMLSETNQAIVHVKSAEELFREICRIAVEHGGLWIAFVGLVDAEGKRVTPGAYRGPAQEFLRQTCIPLSTDIAEWSGPIAIAVREGRPYVCTHAFGDLTTIPWHDEIRRLGCRAAAAFPFHQEGRVAGVLSLHASDAGYFDAQIVELLTDMAADISFALDHIEQSRARAEAEAALRLRNRAIEASVNAIVITSCACPELSIEYVNPAYEKITGYSAAEVLGRNPAFLYGQDRAQPGIEDIRAAVRKRRNGHATLRNYRKDGSLFWNDLHIAPVRNGGDTVTHFVAVFEDVTDVKSYQEQLERQANFDTLTGLANRNLLRDRLTQALINAKRYERSVAVAWIDLDNFKLINESFGHGAGDELLRIVGQRVKSCLRASDTVARMGGDEFVLILPEQSGWDSSRRVAQRIDEAVSSDPIIVDLLERLLSTISEPIGVEGQEFHITCSIGLSLYPDDGQDPDVLLKNADAAMYRAKELGRNNHQFYTAEMNAQIAERLTLRAKLRHASQAEGFLLHYQPKVDLKTGRISGFEALLRWNDPELGMVPPATFIPVLEESGMIHDVGRWVIRRAMLEHVQALRQFPQFPRIAVNVSSVQLARNDFVATVENVVREVGPGVIALDLEITESLIMKDVEENIAKLSAVRQIGVGISIDDFGTGYSSLSYLARLPVDSLKIDRSFIKDIETNPDSLAIVSTIISLAHALELRVIAEGVETEGQKNILILLSCDEFQGFLFSPALPLERALELAMRE